ncbi:MAG: hypothetical protein HRT45_10035 [Bdellovibrionales bacterium]|nr:hypothetical protein [Bdellovibrionales bacterium]
MRSTQFKEILSLILALFMSVLSVGVLLFCVSSYAQAQDEIDYLKLASVLASNGHYARAGAELEKVAKDQKKQQTIVYNTTRGLVRFHNKEFAAARDSFKAAIKAVKKSRDIEKKQKAKKLLSLRLYLVQCAFSLNDYSEVLGQVERRPELLSRSLAWSLLVASHWALGEKVVAWDRLSEAALKFQSDSNFQMQKVSYLLELGLNNEAFVEGKRAVEGFDLQALSYLKLGGLFKRSKMLDRALWFFELGVLKYPSAELLSVELAHTYSLKGYRLSAARVFEKLAVRKTKYYADVSELYRQQGKLARAEYFNGLVEDQPKKFRQRFSLALGQKNFARALSMKPSLSRLGLFEDQNLVYALAFAQYQMGSLNPAKETLAKITDADLFEKVVALQTTIGECEDKPWECE